jgi:hypothetical protein
VSYADDLDYWAVSEYDDCRVVSRAYETFPAGNALAALTPLCPPAIETLLRVRVRACMTGPMVTGRADIVATWL